MLKKSAALIKFTRVDGESYNLTRIDGDALLENASI